MSIVIRDVREHELDSVLALNNNAGLAILPLDAARLRLFYETAEYFRVAERDGNLAGFLIGFGSDSPHDSSNFAWFKQHLTSKFFYIDRIVVASRRRGGGVGRAFYADAQSYAELRYPQLTCEVFLDHGADAAHQQAEEDRQAVLHAQHRRRVGADTKEGCVAEAHHAAQVTEQGPRQGDTADDERSDYQRHHVGVAAQQYRDQDIHRQ